MRKRLLLWVAITVVITLLASCAQESKDLQTEGYRPVITAVRMLDLSPLPAIATQPQSVNPTLTTTPNSENPISPTKSPGTDANLANAADASSTPSCTNRAEFIKHLSVSLNTYIKPGTLFAKIWEVKNSGTCVWTTGYSLVFVNGDGMTNSTSIPLSHTVQPGETIELRVDLVAPQDPDFYTGNWMLQDESGNPFGVGQSGDQPLEVTIVTMKKNEPGVNGC